MLVRDTSHVDRGALPAQLNKKLPLRLTNNGLQVRLINVGARPDVSELVLKHPAALSRTTGELFVRSHPLFETHAQYVPEVAPFWCDGNAPPAPMPAAVSLSERLPPAAGIVQRSERGARTAGALAHAQPQRADAGKSGSIDALRSALRSEEERKVHREARLHTLGGAIPRKMPDNVRPSHAPSPGTACACLSH